MGDEIAKAGVGLALGPGTSGTVIIKDYANADEINYWSSCLRGTFPETKNPFHHRTLRAPQWAGGDGGRWAGDTR
jgi:hypothetical protein